MNDITKIKVDGEPESSYKLFSKNREFEKRAGGNTGSQSSIQPDWNQNDETQPDYVKNRPFYTGDPVETVLIEESTATFRNGEAQLKTTFVATVGETYKVSWDGTVYECTCADYSGEIFIGNTSILGEGSDTGEPFIIVVFNGKGIQIATTNTSTSHTFSISGFVQEVVKIDPKYIRDMYYAADPVETVFVEESTVSFADKGNGLYGAQVKSTFVPTVGETYKVSWDGTVYECTCADYSGEIFIGNTSILGEGSDTGEPFIIVVFNGKGIQIATTNTSTSHTFSISGFVQEVVKIDEKYLPENLATKSDVDEKLGNCIKTVNGTAPDANGNVEVQTISEDALSTNQYGTAIIVKNGVVFKNRLGRYVQMPIGESNSAFLVKEGETSNVRDTIFAFAVATDASNPISVDQICLSRNGINFNSENVEIRSFKPGNNSVGVIQLNGSTSHGVMVEITKNSCFVLPSSTAGSTKKFKITVDDSGALTATEVT